MLEDSRVDYHVHWSESDGEARPDQIPELARQAGLAACAITDHFDPQAPGYDPVPGESPDLPRLLAMLKWRDEWRSSHREHGTELFVGIERGPAPVLLGGAAPDLVIASVHYLPADIPTVRGRFFDETYWHVSVLDVASGPQADPVGHMAGYLPINPMPGSTFEERREIEREIAQVLRARLVREGVLRCGGARHSL